MLNTYAGHGAVGDGQTDDTEAIKACHAWCIANKQPCRPGSGTFRVTGRILDYRRDRDGPASFHMFGDGKGLTTFKVDDAINAVFKISGDTSAPWQPRADNWSFRDITIKADPALYANIFKIDVASDIDLIRVAIREVKGTAILLREVWDSRMDVSVMRCGDADTNSPAIVLNPYFPDDEPDLGTNNIDFTDRFQVAQSNHVAMRIGRYCKENLIRGKFHGKLDTSQPGEPELTPLDVPMLEMVGATWNKVRDVTFSVATAPCILMRAHSGGQRPLRNSVVGCTFKTQGDYWLSAGDADGTTVAANNNVLGDSKVLW